MKITCPFHANGQERTPSLEIYQTGYYCFSCSAKGPLTDLGLTKEPVLVPRKQENLQEKLTYIAQLPLLPQRGLTFPTNKEGFYIVWPNKEFYIKRLYTGKIRYISPSGHKRPPFAYLKNHKLLILVEGEINAMSLNETGIDADIISPGSAGEFGSPQFQKYLDKLPKYHKIVILVDDDTPGVIAGIEAKSYLLTKCSQIILVLMKHDANDYLVKYGKEKLKEYIKSYI